MTFTPEGNIVLPAPGSSLGGLIMRDLDRRLAMGNRLIALADKFMVDNRVTCAEATTNDRVYENAPELIEALAEIVGYAARDD